MEIALVGLGMVAGTHAKAIQSIGDDVRLAGVLSRHKDRAEKFVEEHCSETADPITIYENISEIAADPRIEIVALCTPPNARTEIVKELAEAGKHILIEKPLERTLTAATEIVEICENNNVMLGVFFQHRLRQSALAAREALAQGKLGEIAAVEINVPWWREQAYYDEPGRGTYARDGGGVLISQSIHTIDVAISLVGQVSRVQAMARTTSLHEMESEDFVSAGLEFANGAVGSLLASTASYPGSAESITIHGTKGSASLVSGKFTLSYQDGTSEVVGEEVASGGGADPMAFTHAWHQAVVEDFVDAVRNDRAPAITGRDALKVQSLIEAITKSSREGRILDVPATE
ncbi:MULTISPECIES: Gfo/Idh/MocA family protein [Halocynthiibacter]|uniref:Gfo/Idh/MocA family oxidoreductase n=1 Tax=Halocynthiibacter halioticoli TaxID=2986804 RepID=A0AAE3IZT8_9RHOB|nr:MULTISPECIES: Gfo/Idh/MocA family oxidoreductase [Halocynthiibacter]MCV6825123.1 Gfo/Idh/MocA family oxidoreductase [Halocynthiibacter halioticoli]MCW4058124.1 Gfo/Idh/MocA family oxidoreductase [Halocynthiibacter sp. SDUM655004]